MGTDAWPSQTPGRFLSKGWRTTDLLGGPEFRSRRFLTTDVYQCGTSILLSGRDLGRRGRRFESVWWTRRRIDTIDVGGRRLWKNESRRKTPPLRLFDSVSLRKGCSLKTSGSYHVFLINDGKNTPINIKFFVSRKSIYLFWDYQIEPRDSLSSKTRGNSS